MASESLLGSKRRASSDAQQSSLKRHRNRVSFSCAECHRRKQKCDRQQPCSHCVSRKLPELCRPYTPGRSDHDVHARIARLEQIIEIALPQYSNIGRLVESREASSSPDEHIKGSSSDRPGGDTLRTVVRSPFLEQLQNNSLSSMLVDTPAPAARLQSLVLECGFPPTVITELVKQLPDANLSRALVDYYFTSINYTRCPLYEPLFRFSYKSIGLNQNNLHPSDIRFLPVLFAVLALSMRLSPNHMANDRVRRSTSLRFYWSSRRALLIASAIQTNSLEIILTHLLGARFNLFERRITESWSEVGAAVRIAQALGLHRDPSNLKLDSFQTEYRRRIWAYVYHADRACAFITDRPKSISDCYSSTRAPLNIDDAFLESPSCPVDPQPLSNPTPITFAILRHTLAGITGRMTHYLQQVQGHDSYSNVLALEEELKMFISSLPPCYALADPDTSFDEIRPYVPVHRFLLLTEVMFYRIGLHRPYFLRRLDIATFDPSREACIDSAKHDSKVRHNFYQISSRQVVDATGGMFRAFQSTMICGLALIIDPNRDDAQEMHAILDNFLRTTCEPADRELDVATQKELKIINFLRSKVVNKFDSDTPSSPSIASITTSETGGPVLSDTESGLRPLGFPQSATRQPPILPPSTNRPPFVSNPSTQIPGPIPSDVGSQPSMTSYTGDVGTRPGVWDSWYEPNDQTFQANEQWAGGSDIVPDMMVTMFNDENRPANGPGEWSYWEALVNQIRVGGVSG
ncbi:fungal-specific transcription factor domain-containing protein [Gautieria morchelliformis]|nr:fungal-specific transcription factor domain-containing protein [Gautieria morchelliformis]